MIAATSHPGWFRAARVGAGDLLGVMAVILCIPFAILAVGIPVALLGRLLLWIARLL